jgi:cytochrome c oxidase subunit I+III
MSAIADAVRAWERPRGAATWVADHSHRAIGLRLILTGFGFFALAGLAALVMRVQLAAPDRTVLGPETYDQLFSLHGATMMSVFAVPTGLGFGLYVVPLELGTREAALPRLAAFAYWLFAAAAATLWIALAFGEAPDSGWFNYVPLASPRYQPGFHADVYAGCMLLLQVSAILLAIVLITTILCRRAPGMALHKMPLMAWAVLVGSVMILFAMPPLVVACTMLVMESKLGASFFEVPHGGDPLLWQQLFWFFGHPLVYLMLLPALGVVSSVTASFAKRPMVGYPLIVTSYVLIGIISMGVWMHHMFAVGQAWTGAGVFSAATFAVAVPSGIHVFAVLATLWYGKVKFDVPLLFVLAFIWTFVAGGITGVTVGSISFDSVVTDTYYVVAHFHYVLLGGVVLPLLGGTWYWWPKFTGWMPDRRIGTVAFALIFVGVQVTFFPMHALGLEGMRRRIWTYPSGLGFGDLNLVVTIGAFVIAAGLGLFLVGLVAGVRRRPAGPDPWGSGTLEWATASPPPPHGFDRTPVVTSHYPLWEQDQLGDAEARHPLTPGRHEIIGTSAVDAAVVRRDVEPERTQAPAVAALCAAIAAAGTIVDPLIGVGGLALTFVACVDWLRPRQSGDPAADEADVRGPVWYGTALGLGVLAVTTGAWLVSWYYLAAKNGEWPIPPVEGRPLLLGLALTLLLGAAVGAVVIRRLVAAAALALAFCAVQAIELIAVDYNQATNASASAEFAISGVFALLVLVLGGMTAVAAVWLRGDRLPPSGLRSLRMYALFLGASWPLIAFTVYIATRIGL